MLGFLRCMMCLHVGGYKRNYFFLGHIRALGARPAKVMCCSIVTPNLSVSYQLVKSIVLIRHSGIILCLVPIVYGCKLMQSNQSKEMTHAQA